jgi:hypothetical protein
MSPPVPQLGAATAAVFRLHWKRLVRGKKLRLGAIAVGLVIVAVVAARYAQDAAPASDVMRAGLSLGFFTMLVFLVPFLLTSGAIAEEVESRTFAYLSSRPVSRLAITLGNYTAGVAAALAILGGGIVIMHVAVFLTEPGPMIDELPATLRAGGAILLLTLLYGAICTFWGAVATEAAGIVSALYLAIVEFAFSMLPGIFRFVSMNYMAQQLGGLPKAGLRPDLVPDMETWVPVVTIVPMTFLFLVLSAVVVGASEYRFGRA